MKTKYINYDHANPYNKNVDNYGQFSFYKYSQTSSQ